MELAKIEQLLESYFEGETTLQEEKTLRTYFTGTEVAPHLRPYVGMFSAFAKAQQETYDAPIILPKKRRKYSWIASAAAAVVLCIGLYTQIQPKQTITSSYDDPKVAVQKATQALGMVSKLLAQSTAQLETVKEFENTSSKFFKQ